MSFCCVCEKTRHRLFFGCFLLLSPRGAYILLLPSHLRRVFLSSGAFSSSSKSESSVSAFGSAGGSATGLVSLVSSLVSSFFIVVCVVVCVTAYVTGIVVGATARVGALDSTLQPPPQLLREARLPLRSQRPLVPTLCRRHAASCPQAAPSSASASSVVSVFFRGSRRVCSQ